jgi:hypothetical protein
MKVLLCSVEAYLIMTCMYVYMTAPTMQVPEDHVQLEQLQLSAAGCCVVAAPVLYAFWLCRCSCSSRNSSSVYESGTAHTRQQRCRQAQCRPTTATC